MRYIFSLLPFYVFASLLLAAPVQGQVTVDLPDRADQDPGAPLDLPVILTEAVDEDDNIHMYELTVEYDPSVLTITDARLETTVAENPSQFDVTTSEPGQVSVTAEFDDAITGGPGELVILEAEIKADASGSSALTFSAFRFGSGTPASVATGGRVATEPLPTNSNLAINELHADPATESDCERLDAPSTCGDANNDGTRSAGEDEFVEIINAGSSPIDVGEYTIADETGTRFTFPPETSLAPNTAAVIFGGGTPTDIPGQVFTADGTLGLNNGGDALTLRDDAGTVVAALRYGNNAIADVSITRSPDIDGAFDAHTEASLGGALFSPGRTLDGSALPVELSKLEAVRDERDVVLRWTTASETNNSGFSVQHLQDGVFQEIAFVDGAGTTTQMQRYAHRVRGLAPGPHTFRLKQVDFDGTTALSPSVKIAIPLGDRFTLEAAHPNPFRTTATLSLEVRKTQEVSVTLYNMLGQRIQRLFSGTLRAGVARPVTIDGRHLSSGTYVYRIRGRTFSATRQITLVR